MFLKIKTIPSTIWSSDHPLNFMPPFKTILFLVLGLAVFGFGSSLLIHSGIGNSPWVVLAEGLSIQLGGTIGIWTFGCSMVVLVVTCDEIIGEKALVVSKEPAASSRVATAPVTTGRYELLLEFILRVMFDE